MAIALLPFYPAHLQGCQPPADALVSLGRDCQIAYQMKINGFRKEALPFDQLLTSCDSLSNMLSERLEGFLEPSNFALITKGNPAVNGGNYVLDEKYKSYLIHDFKLNKEYMDDFNRIKEAYQRRIKRLLEIIDKSAHPLFIRKEASKEQALAIHKILTTLRNNKPFTLAVLDTTPEIKEDWNLKEHGIRNFYLRQPEPYEWTGDNNAWKEIFTSLGLSLPSKENSTTEK